MKKQELNDSQLETISGGKLSLTAWRDYLTNHVMVPLENLAVSANANDQAVIANVKGRLMETTFPNAAVKVPVQNLWNDWNASIRGTVTMDSVKFSVGQLLQNCVSYVNSNV